MSKPNHRWNKKLSEVDRKADPILTCIHCGAIREQRAEWRDPLYSEAHRNYYESYAPPCKPTEERTAKA